jgi:branched-subunit amino acid aminotransferase/4-amino-4-deoxychorismate lyase
MGAELKVWLNGEIIPESSARLPVSERGFLYADGIFTTFRFYGGKAFLAEKHFLRLTDSSSFLGLPKPRMELFGFAEELAAKNGHQEGACRITISRGSLPAGPRPGFSSSPTILITTRPLPHMLEERREKGIRGSTLPWPSRSEGLPLHGHKTLAYLPSVIALGLVEEGVEPIMETTGGFLSEGATSNLFWCRDEVLYTPSLTSGCLPGVGRALAIELAEKAGIRVEEGLFARGELFRAHESFVTNSVSEITPLIQVDGTVIGDGLPGPLTSRLQIGWTRTVKAFRGKSV